MGIIRMGSRDSALAVAQAQTVSEALRCIDGTLEIELVTMKTSGDFLLDRPLSLEGGKGLFTRELDNALLDNRIDLAVHSLKDIPSAIPDGLCLAAFCAEDDPRDALVLSAGAAAPAASLPLGCAGKRREVQLSMLFPDWPCALVRGNVPTRLEKLDRGTYGGLVLAAAGLRRLGLAGRITRLFDPSELLPAAGQGILGCVTRVSSPFAALFAALEENCRNVRPRALCERAFIQTLGGGCGTPIAAFAQIEADSLRLRGFYAPAGAPGVTGEISGPAAQSETLGKTLAFRLLAVYNREQGRQGRVTLAGAGPGDSGLLTLKAEAALSAASVVVYDNLAGKGILARLPSGAEKIYAGKETGHHAMTQQAINELLIRKAAEGAAVVRLKGGDPFLFGRGGEEALALQEAGIPFDVIPGISSALAVPAAAGIPVTLRGAASQVHIIAAKNSDGAPLDYAALAKASGTLVFLMGVDRLDELCRSLIDAGLPSGTPAAIIARGTTAGQQSIVSTLGGLPLRAHDIRAPAITVVGAVCAVAETLAPQISRPLAGIRIAVTRPRSRPSSLSSLLSALGAEVLDIPSIVIRNSANATELEWLFDEPRIKSWLVFTSVHGVEAFFEALRTHRLDIRALAAARFAAAGKASLDALEAHGIRVELAASGSQALTAELIRHAAGETVTLLRSALGNRELPLALQQAGLCCYDIPLYDTAAAPGYEDAAYRRCLMEGLTWAAFTSASTVENFTEIFAKEIPAGLKALCIGETTARAAREHGFPSVAAENHTLESMVEALLYSVQCEHTL